MICNSCAQDPDGECWAEQFKPLYDRIGHHGGRCWDGSFPASKHYVSEAAAEESEIQDEDERLKRPYQPQLW